jgi:glycyl-tRNA synthetase beta chain
MFAVGERPTGSRDPLGLRRQAQGAMKLLVDLPEVTGLTARLRVGPLLTRAGAAFPGGSSEAAVQGFVVDRLAYVLEQRGHDVRAVRAVLHGDIGHISPLEARLKLDALAQMSGSTALLGVAALLKRVKNITKGVSAAPEWAAVKERLVEPAERALAAEVDAQAPRMAAAAARGDYRDVFAAVAALQPSVAAFFDDVLVMAEDAALREARLSLVAALRDLILDVADLSEMVVEERAG